MSFKVVIPARYQSTRLPGKPLLDIAGKPMIQHVYERALESGAEAVIIATDDERIAKVAESFCPYVCETAPDHPTGTDRIAEAAVALGFDEDDIIINVQGDEPLIDPNLIRQLAQDLEKHDNARVASVCAPIKNPADLFNPNIVKVVMNRRSYALYFSRAPIPWDRETFKDCSTFDHVQCQTQHYRHIGLYGYRVGFLAEYTEWDDCKLEQIERLEQLRILWYGTRIHMIVTPKLPGMGVDTKEDLEKVRKILT